MLGGANGVEYGGYGTVLKITPSGTLTTLYSFCSQSGCTDGADPIAGLILATNGDFYGTAAGGGTNGYGMVFSLSVTVTKTTTTLTSSPNPSTYGQAVTFIATVTSKLGAPPDGETVSFMKGKTVLGTGTLSGGSASFTRGHTRFSIWLRARVFQVGLPCLPCAKATVISASAVSSWTTMAIFTRQPSPAPQLHTTL